PVWWWLCDGVGGFSYRGKTTLRIITSNQDSLGYMLSEHLLPYAHYGTDFMLLHDGASFHRSLETKDFLEEQHITALETLQTLAMSMKSRCVAVIKGHGAKTKF
ncbi:TPA: hypothetical protein N0F65_006721, partial [Lagenidium giganteum]